MQASLLTYVLIGIYGIVFDAHMTSNQVDVGSEEMRKETRSHIDSSSLSGFSGPVHPPGPEFHSNGTLGQRYDAPAYGSAACSARYSAGNCWRYCNGNDGPWCYTTNFCILGKTRCDAFTTCTVECGWNSDYGCNKNCHNFGD